MKLLTPEFGLIAWIIVSASILLLMVVALLHLFLYKRIVEKESLVWILAIVFVPVFGALIYFKSSRQHKQIQ